MKEAMLQVGVITQPHGVRGAVKVYPTTDDVTRYKKLKKVYLKPNRLLPPQTQISGQDYAVLHVEEVKYLKQMVVVSFRELSTMNEAELLRQTPIYVTREDAVPLGENENYIADLIDMEVYTEAGLRLGICTDVLITGANDVYIVTPETGREILLPAIPSCILSVDVEGNRMTVSIPEGLLD